MADPADEPRTPPPPGRPGQPLPRLRYTPPADSSPPPPPTPAAKPAKRGKKSEGTSRPGDTQAPKKSKAAKGGDEEPKGVLVEATPTLDTYEVRQRTRIAVGVLMLGIVLIAGLLLVRMFRSENPDEFGDIDYGELATFGVDTPDRQALEREAQVALVDARGFAEQANADRTLDQLRHVLTAFPGTTAAKQAQEALDRGRQGLPLFSDVPLIIAELAEATEPESAAEVVVGSSSLPDRPVAELPPPSVPPEPQRWTGIRLETAEVSPKTLPEGFRPRPGIGVHPSGWPLEITCDHDGAAMVLVPGGTFTMGRDDGPAEERPAHQVALPPYYIDQHEVTVGQYRIFQQATGYNQGGPPLPDSAETEPVPPTWPVTQVSARDAFEYARWAGKSLPTEAQWEMAARTIDGRIHPWGASPPNWERPRELGQIDPVMTFALDMSPYGVFDLAGNAREWTADWFDPGYFEQFRESTAVNPKGPGRGTSRIPLLTIKGSSPDWYVSRRDGMRPEARVADIGFRCVLNLDAPAPAIPTPPTTPSLAIDRPRVAPSGSRVIRFPPGSMPF